MDKTLRAKIIEQSESNDWGDARLEWKLEEIWFAEFSDGEACLCSHSPICEVCVLRNTLNDRSVEVGNHCVEKFIGLSSDKIFQSFKRVRKDLGRSLSPEAINYAHAQNCFDRWARRFYLAIRRKRVLTDRQRKYKNDLNRKFVAMVGRSHKCQGGWKQR